MNPYIPKKMHDTIDFCNMCATAEAAKELNTTVADMIKGRIDIALILDESGKPFGTLDNRAVY